MATSDTTRDGGHTLRAVDHRIRETKGESFPRVTFTIIRAANGAENQ